MTVANTHETRSTPTAGEIANLLGLDVRVVTPLMGLRSGLPAVLPEVESGVAVARKKPRRGRGEGSIEQLPSGKWRAILPGRKKAGRSATFTLRSTALDWLRANAGLPANPVGTLAEWLDRWEQLRRTETAPATWRKDEHTVKRHIRPRLGAVKMRELTALRVRSYFAELAAANVTPGERHKAGKVLRLTLNAAVYHGLLNVNPINGKHVKLPSRPRSEAAAFSPAELAAILVAADQLGYGAMFRLWADAGVRPGELLGLLREDIDLGQGVVHVRRSLCAMTGRLKDLKTKWSRRTLPLAASTLSALAELPDRGPVLFPAPRGGHWWRAQFDRIVLQAVFAKAGVSGTGYQFRHSAATHMLQDGEPLAIVAQRLGHQNGTTTLAHYAHALLDGQRRAAERIDKRLPPYRPDGHPA